MVWRVEIDELHRLKVGSLQLTEEGYEVVFTHAKQLGEVKENKILVPFNRSDPPICLATKIQTYLEALGPAADNKQDSLFKGCGKSHFVKANMGKNLLHNIGKDVAR